jgi:hypothetical protein
MEENKEIIIDKYSKDKNIIIMQDIVYEIDKFKENPDSSIKILLTIIKEYETNEEQYEYDLNTKWYFKFKDELEKIKLGLNSVSIRNEIIERTIRMFKEELKYYILEIEKLLIDININTSSDTMLNILLNNYNMLTIDLDLLENIRSNLKKDKLIDDFISNRIKNLLNDVGINFYYKSIEKDLMLLDVSQNTAISDINIINEGLDNVNLIEGLDIEPIELDLDINNIDVNEITNKELKTFNSKNKVIDTDIDILVKLVDMILDNKDDIKLKLREFLNILDEKNKLLNKDTIVSKYNTIVSDILDNKDDIDYKYVLKHIDNYVNLNYNKYITVLKLMCNFAIVIEKFNLIYNLIYTICDTKLLHKENDNGLSEK